MDDGKTWLPELEGKCGGSSKPFVWNFLMANMIVVLTETVSRPEKQFSLRFLMLINGGVVVCKFFQQMQDNVLKWVG